MAKYDVTKLNVAIDKLLQTTTNSRHRFLLQAYSRHRYLEVAGRYEEIFAPEMMAQMAGLRHAAHAHRAAMLHVHVRDPATGHGSVDFGPTTSLAGSSRQACNLGVPILAEELEKIERRS